MSLQFLNFDFSEDPEGGGTFDAMASVRSAQLAAARAEIAEVLDWAETAFAGQRAPLDEGGEWDVDLQEHADAASPPWHVLTLSISGSAAFCAAFMQRFGLDSDD
ncbi:hypothetical protein [Polaromonas eurypsychrophila]|uniref:Uncharacterized protein n=1 Tax=Polaromonas eurypsychrophila TaxID=1614635 RepID=A0A916WEV4_9BURK|nr:hypothetical protein [Polaromonas eurypsychrophila]GGA91672.1 hypothetical protein GCM10011496_10760 [Polaromonas eurypsychrophila]